MESFLIALNAVVPYVFYVGFGYFLKVVHIADTDLFNRMNRVVFRAFFPVMLFYNMYSIDRDFEPNWKLIIFAVVSLLVLIVALCLIVPRLVKEDAKRGVIIQAIFRSNFLLFAVPLAVSLFGQEGGTVAVMMVAFVVPIYNIAAVFVLESFRGGEFKLTRTLGNVITNPLILGALVGLIFFLARIRLPYCIEEPISQISSLCVPLGMLVLGGTLQFSKIYGNLRYLIPTVGVKMVVLPALILSLAYLMGFSPLERFVLFVMYGTPVAVASYSMAVNMNGDGELAGELVVISTVVSLVTIFFWIFFLRSIAFI